MNDVVSDWILLIFSYYYDFHNFYNSFLLSLYSIITAYENSLIGINFFKKYLYETSN